MKEILRKIRKIEREQARRKASPLARYNKGKVHIKQMQFHRCLKRNRWVFGGNRSGKTECGAVETVWLARVYRVKGSDKMQSVKINGKGRSFDVEIRSQGAIDVRAFRLRAETYKEEYYGSNRFSA